MVGYLNEEQMVQRENRRVMDRRFKEKVKITTQLFGGSEKLITH